MPPTRIIRPAPARAPAPACGRLAGPEPNRDRHAAAHMSSSNRLRRGARGPDWRSGLEARAQARATRSSRAAATTAASRRSRGSRACSSGRSSARPQRRALDGQRSNITEVLTCDDLRVGSAGAAAVRAADAQAAERGRHRRRDGRRAPRRAPSCCIRMHLYALRTLIHV